MQVEADIAQPALIGGACEKCSCQGHTLVLDTPTAPMTAAVRPFSR